MGIRRLVQIMMMLMLIAASSSCRLFMPENGGSIELQFRGDERKIWNPQVPMEIDSYMVTLTKQEQSVTVTNQSTDRFIIDALEPGFWEIDVKGLNENDDIVAELKEEDCTLYVRRGEVVTKTVTLVPLSSVNGETVEGNLEFTVDRSNVNSQVMPESPSLTVHITNINCRFDGYPNLAEEPAVKMYRAAGDDAFGDEEIPLIEPEMEDGEDGTTFWVTTSEDLKDPDWTWRRFAVLEQMDPVQRVRMEGLPVGWYEVVLEMNSQGDELWKRIFFARMAGSDTVSEVIIDDLSLERGGMEIVVEEDLQDAIDGVSFTGDIERSLGEDHEVTLQFTAGDDYDAYFWYVNGDPAGEEETMEYTFGAAGPYRVVLSVFHNGYWGSHSELITIQASGD